MLNTIYRLVEPMRFEAQFTDIDIKGDDVIVRPTHLSICNADRRYYQGKRPPEVLQQKLPMALIHEGIGKVVFDKKGEFIPGQMVVMVPNTPVEEDEVIAENYLRSSSFRSSGTDGFMQDNVAMKRDRIVPLHKGMNKKVASFTELAAVSYHTINRFGEIAHKRRKTIGVWGDGNLAFITSLFLKKRMPESRIIIFGKNDWKMVNFPFADGTYNITAIPKDLHVDHAFECVGREASGAAVNQIIDHINPEGTIAIMGVSEVLVPLNTRMMLEKGLRMVGSSRCGKKDFCDTLEFYRNNPEVVEYMQSIVGSVVRVKTMADINKAFEEDIKAPGGKTVIIWEK